MKDKILEKFLYFKNKPSDINEHFDALLDTAKECSHITEFGVRTVVSSWALLHSRPKTMISYDISYHIKENIEELIDVAKNNQINFNFILADVLKVDIEETDMLFIDTLHTYKQLSQELVKHANKVKKYIVLHDTETFGYTDESVYNHASELSKNNSNKHGLVAAIDEFLKSEQGSNWTVKKKFTHNNGLTIIERVY
jgi:3-methyladenine DNA glycosylase AlkC